MYGPLRLRAPHSRNCSSVGPRRRARPGGFGRAMPATGSGAAKPHALRASSKIRRSMLSSRLTIAG